MSPLSSASRAATQECVVTSKLLIGLPEGTPQITYTNMKTLKGVIDARCRKCAKDDSQSPFLVVTSIPSIFLKHLDFDRGRRFTANLQENLAVFEVMIYPAHEVVSTGLGTEISMDISRMGLDDEIFASGSPSFIDGNGIYAQVPDASFMLDDDLKWKNGRIWPILTIETGLFESESKLAIDAQRWLEVDGSRTKVVITAKLDRQAPRVTFQRWEHHLPPFRPFTRHFHPTGSVMEEVVATHEGGITRVNGSITIPFEKVLNRARRGPNERNVVVGQNELARLCERGWKAQGFM
ncbi:uncharacterized protein GIQ15_01833 [Arthroderma uncinatum]|uniref:uncharacterized protein n=1 Tax=Arthroderma uncinatum TaxID=74035 RepID=UPI00144A66B3|nr:uncharacterized protein GIQ15_01833 [Arthroderma uncinatum]KAF3492316.1 hypothetical protein GIQ15_01833 [Arthroderma uncinatum]